MIPYMQKVSDKNGSGLILLIDALALALGFAGPFFALRAGLQPMPDYTATDATTYAMLLAFSFLIVSFLEMPTNRMLLRPWPQELMRLCRNAVLTAGLFSVMLILIKSPLFDSRYLLVYTFVLWLVLTCLFHAIYRRILLRWYSGVKTASLLGVVTTAARADEILGDVASDYTRKLARVFLIDGNGDAPGSLHGAPVTVGTDALVGTVTQDALDEVLFCVPYETLLQMEDAVDEIKSTGVVVHFNVPLIDAYAGVERTVDMIGGCPVVSIAVKSLDPRALAVKRVCDVLFGSLGLLLSAPIILLAAIPLKLESKGPLFFSQQRIGRNGRVFRIYKLRSMYVDAEQRKAELLDKNEMQGLMFKIRDDPRITKVGRFLRASSIDELPQFFNVVKGDMSLVGPRPPLVDEFRRYESRYKRRLSMRPGITGIWQTSGRNQVPDFEDVVRMDLAYIDNWSLGLDARILCKTVAVVLSLSGR